jgi:hypothetical protein
VTITIVTVDKATDNTRAAGLVVVLIDMSSVYGLNRPMDERGSDLALHDADQCEPATLVIDLPVYNV